MRITRAIRLPRLRDIRIVFLTTGVLMSGGSYLSNPLAFGLHYPWLPLTSNTVTWPTPNVSPVHLPANA